MLLDIRDLFKANALAKGNFVALGQRINLKMVPGGHIGLFMGGNTLLHAWPDLAKWIQGVGRKQR